MRNDPDLKGEYDAALRRIKAQGEKETRVGMAVLMWIIHSRRPLKVDEICYAIAIRIGSKELNNDDIPAILTLLDYCQGLVTIDGTSTIMLIHHTLQDYLCTHPDFLNTAHSTIAETCLTYLNFQNVKDSLTGPSPDP